MIEIVTDPRVLEQFPHLSPTKDRVVDMIPAKQGPREAAVLVYGPEGNPREGHGRVARCSVCGTLLRTGQPHSSAAPVPHASLAMVTVVEPELMEEGAGGGPREFYHGDTQRALGRTLPASSALVQGDDGLWREVTA